MLGGQDDIWLVVRIGFSNNFGHEVSEMALAFGEKLILSLCDTEEMLHVIR